MRPQVSLGTKERNCQMGGGEDLDMLTAQQRQLSVDHGRSGMEGLAWRVEGEIVEKPKKTVLLKLLLFLTMRAIKS